MNKIVMDREDLILDPHVYSEMLFEWAQLFIHKQVIVVHDNHYHHPVVPPMQDSELKRTVDESERIQRAYGHYFDLNIINDSLEGAFCGLKTALERLSSEQQWVPVSWVF